MYLDTLNKVTNLLEQVSGDNGTIFIATISPDGNTGNATFYGDTPKMIKLLTSLVKLADQRDDGAILKEVIFEVFSKGLVNIEI